MMIYIKYLNTCQLTNSVPKTTNKDKKSSTWRKEYKTECNNSNRPIFPRPWSIDNPSMMLAPNLSILTQHSSKTSRINPLPKIHNHFISSTINPTTHNHNLTYYLKLMKFSPRPRIKGKYLLLSMITFWMKKTNQIFQRYRRMVIFI